jgi:hypothetical protein
MRYKSEYAANPINVKGTHGRRKKTKRPRGTGSQFDQPGSSVIWCQVYAGGQRRRESTGTDNRRKAQKYLSDRLPEVSQGSFNPEATKVTVAALVDTKLTTDRNNGSKSIEDTEARWTLDLEPYFASMKAAKVSTTLLSMDVAKRLEEKAKPATINRELALLRAAFYLAYESTPPCWKNATLAPGS